jgi:hypothetical protein
LIRIQQIIQTLLSNLILPFSALAAAADGSDGAAVARTPTRTTNAKMLNTYYTKDASGDIYKMIEIIIIITAETI